MADVYIVVRRHKTTIFTEVKEHYKISDVKKILKGILNREPVDMKLGDETHSKVYEDDRTLSEYGMNGTTGKAHTPCPISLVLRDEESGKFEDFRVENFSSPPDLPEVMKQTEGSAPSSGNIGGSD